MLLAEVEWKSAEPAAPVTGTTAQGAWLIYVFTSLSYFVYLQIPRLPNPLNHFLQCFTDVEAEMVVALCQ